MPKPTNDSADLAQTTDQPGAPGALSEATGRRVDTSRRSDPVDSPTGDLPLADASSVTGGYTPSNQPAGTPGEPSVPGYELLDELGRGGMGVVYRARQIALDRLVALKMILAGAHARPKDLDRFRAEAQAVAKFQHQNIVQIHEVGEVDGLPYFSLEYVGGGTLSQKISRDPQPPRFSAELVESLAKAMQYAHDHGIIHRDLKPANVLLTENGTPKITDFGLAKRFEEDSGRTQAGQILGTPSYMAPEQAYGDTENVGPPADIYALGATLYDLLTGRPPFAGSSMLDTLEMVRTREPVPPGNLAGNIPRDLETIALKCLQKDKAKRYESAAALADDLRRFLDGRPILARPVSTAEKAWRWAKRNPWLAGLGTSVAALLIAVAAVTSIMSYQLNIEKKGAEKAREDEETERIKAEDAKIKEEIAKNKAIDEQKKALEAQAITAEQRRLALDTIRAVLLRVDDLMRFDSRLFDSRTKIMETMLPELDKIRTHALANPLENRTEAVAYQRIGDIYLKMGRVQTADEWMKKALPILQKNAEDPKDPAALYNLSGILNQIADVEWRLGNQTKARDLYAEALAIRLKRPKSAIVDESVAISYRLVAFADLRLGDNVKAESNYLASEAKYATLPADRLRNLFVRRDRAENLVRLADARFRTGKLREAEKHYQDALNERLELLRKTPQEPYASQLKNDIALTLLSIGDFRLMANDDALGATVAYVEALDRMSAATKAAPDNMLFRRSLSAAHYRLGAVSGQRPPLAALTGCAADLAPAASHFEQCLSLRAELAKIDQSDVQGQMDLMLVLARVGKTEDVEKMAARLFSQAGKERGALFYIASALALASTGDSATAVRCRDQAFKVLGALMDAGWNDRVSLAKDPDLAPIRKDKRFDEIVAKLSPSGN